MIPKGPLFNDLRARLLDLYPENSNVIYKSNNTCADWFKSGTYIVDSTTRSGFIVTANKSDFTSVILNEIENLLNHCIEHIKELIINLNLGIEKSDAWQVVTMYYYGYFAAQCFLRLVGRPVINIDRNTIKLIGAASSSTISPNRGNYILEKISDLSITNTQFTFKHLGKNNHEAVWTEVFDVLEKLAQLQTINPDPSETIFFKDLISSGLNQKYDGNGWPSSIRNMANYRPGFAYRAVFKEYKAKTHRLLIDDWQSASKENINTSLDRVIASCIQCKIADYDIHVKYLHSLCHSIYLIDRELYLELFRRKRIVDRRWENQRKVFRENILNNNPGYNLILS